MEYQKFIPEGWHDTKETLSLEKIKQAKLNGEIIQGFAYKCDSNCNIYVKLGEKIEGIIPRNEVDLQGVDENGEIKLGICKNKVNNYVQFKIKEIKDDEKVVLSRKDVCIEALEWAKKELAPGSIVNRNCKKYKTLRSFC